MRSHPLPALDVSQFATIMKPVGHGKLRAAGERCRSPNIYGVVYSRARHVHPSQQAAWDEDRAKPQPLLLANERRGICIE